MSAAREAHLPLGVVGSPHATKRNIDCQSAISGLGCDRGAILSPMVPTLLMECGVLRPWRMDDVSSLALIANSRAIARNLTHLFPHPYTEQNAIDWVTERAGPSGRLLAWAIEVQGQLAGGCGLEQGEGVFRRSAHLGYWLGEAYWGRGIATAATRALVKWAFGERDFVRLEAGVFSWNPASARVLEKVGFVREGVHRKSVERFGELADRAIYAMIRPGVE